MKNLIRWFAELTGVASEIRGEVVAAQIEAMKDEVGGFVFIPKGTFTLKSTVLCGVSIQGTGVKLEEA